MLIYSLEIVLNNSLRPIKTYIECFDKNDADKMFSEFVADILETDGWYALEIEHETYVFKAKNIEQMEWLCITEEVNL